MKGWLKWLDEHTQPSWVIRGTAIVLLLLILLIVVLLIHRIVTT